MELALSSKDILKRILNFLEPHKSANFANVNKFFNKVHRETVRIICRGELFKGGDLYDDYISNKYYKIHNSIYHFYYNVFDSGDITLIRNVSYTTTTCIDKFGGVSSELIELVHNIDENYSHIYYQMLSNIDNVDDTTYSIGTTYEDVYLDKVNDKDIIDILFER